MKPTTRIMKSKLYFIFFLTSLICWSQEEQNIRITSLDEAISLAMENNLNLAINDLQLEKSKIETKLAKSARLPQINGAFNGQKNLELATTFLPGELFGQPGETVPIQFGQEYQYSAGITINKPLINLTNRLALKTKSKDVDIQISDNKIFKELLIGQITYTYHAVILAKEALVIAQEDVVIAKNIFEITQSKFDEGLTELASVHRSKINLNRVKQSLDESKLIYEDTQSKLKDALGIETSKSLEIEAISQFETLNSIEEPVLNENIEFFKSEQLTARAELNLKQSRTEYFPKVSLNSYFGSQLFQNEFSFSINDENWTPVRYVGLSINVPIFNGLSTRRKVKIAKLDAEAAALNHKQEKNRLEAEDALLLKNYKLTASIVTSSLENYQLNKQIVDLEFSKYNEGLVGLEVYLNAFEDYLNAKNGYLNALTSHYQYYAEVYSRSYSKLDKS